MSARRPNLVDKWCEYIYRDSADEVRRFAREFPERRSLQFSFESFGHDYRFSRPLFSDPDAVFRAGREALRRFLPAEAQPQRDRAFETVYLRIGDLPADRDVSVDDIGADQLNELVRTKGRVVDLERPRPKVVEAAFRCSKCEDVTRTIPQRGQQLRTSPKCPNCNSVGYMDFVPAESAYVDAQVAELRRETAAGSERTDQNTVSVLLEHDQVDAVATGETMQVTGIPRVDRNGDSTLLNLWFEATNVES